VGNLSGDWQYWSNLLAVPAVCFSQFVFKVMFEGKGKGKGKVHPRTGHETPERE
jgi:hypothetical protein